MTVRGIGELEVTLRSTLSKLFRSAYGDQWQDLLSSKVRSRLEQTHRLAEQRRTVEVPGDHWATAGLPEIGAVMGSFASRVFSNEAEEVPGNEEVRRAFEALGLRSVQECKVDLDRLCQVRNDDAHPGVIGPLSAAQLAEQEGMVGRMRLGCEQIRRNLMNTEREWFPYIEAVDCPGVSVWGYARNDQCPQVAHLNEGDRLEFVVSAVNTDGTAENLEYGLFVQEDGGSFRPIVPASPSSRLSCLAGPPGRSVIYMVQVRRSSGGHDASGWDDEAHFCATVRPADL